MVYYMAGRLGEKHLDLLVEHQENKNISASLSTPKAPQACEFVAEELEEQDTIATTGSPPFEVFLNRKGDPLYSPSDLGIEFKIEDTYVLVLEVFDKGLIPAWNSQPFVVAQPFLEVRKGDMIIAVNGTYGNEGMVYYMAGRLGEE